MESYALFTGFLSMFWLFGMFHGMFDDFLNLGHWNQIGNLEIDAPFPCLYRRIFLFEFLKMVCTASIQRNIVLLVG